jgi:multiple sugar transport system ATP-binding protein
MNFVPAVLAGEGGWIEVRIGADLQLPVPRAHVQRLSRHLGQPVELGLRPEHLQRAREGDGRTGLAPLEVTVDLIQPTGSRTYATFRLDGVEVMAELQAHDVERPGEVLTLQADMNRAIIVDPGSGQVL